MTEQDVVNLIANILYMLIPALLVLFFLLGSVFTVPGKRAEVLETLGKPHTRARMAGLNFKLPLITKRVGTVNLQIQELGADVGVKTNDNAFMELPVKVQFRASDDPAGSVKAHYELEHPEQQIKSYVLNNVRQTASAMSMVDLYANRDQMETQVQQALSERFADYGYIIVNVLVDEPQPSKEVRDAFNHVIASLRLKEAATNEAEAARIRLVGVAAAEKESKKLQGEGMAEMREAVATGLEKSMKTMTDAGLTPEQAMSFLTETNRLDTITNASAHGNMVIVDTQSGGNIPNTIAAVRAATPASGPRPVSDKGQAA